MISTGVTPCLSSGLAKNNKIMSMFALFSQLFWCMIKIFWGGRGGDTFKIPSPLRTNFAFTHPCFKMFLERSLNDPPPPHFKQSFTATIPPTPSITPSPPKNFDHTLGHFESLALFSKMGVKPNTKAVKQDVFGQFFKGTTIK